MIEFADLQCPYCREYALDALPAIVKEYVRTGKVKLVFFGMHFIGHDSETALQRVYAAGLQGTLERPRPPLQEPGPGELGLGHREAAALVGNSVPGLDGDKMLADRDSAEVDPALADRGGAGPWSTNHPDVLRRQDR